MKSEESAGVAPAPQPWAAEGTAAVGWTPRAELSRVPDEGVPLGVVAGCPPEPAATVTLGTPPEKVKDPAAPD